MRTLKYLFILALSISYLQAEVGWSPPVTLGDGFQVDLDVDANGNGIAVWVAAQLVPGPIQSNKFDFATKTWSPQIPVSLGPGQFGDSPRVAINPIDGNAVAIWHVFLSSFYFSARLPFGTNSWNFIVDPVFPTPTPSPIDLVYLGIPVAAVRSLSNPIIGSFLTGGVNWNNIFPPLDPAGNPQLGAGTGFVINIWTPSAGAAPIFFSKLSTNNLGQWLPPQPPLPIPASVAFPGTDPSLAVDNNTAVVIWRSPGPAPAIKGAFLSPLSSDTWLPTTDLPLGKTPKVDGGNGRFVAVWVDETTNAILGATLNNNTWTLTNPLSNPGQTGENPQVAVDLAGNAYAIWVNSATIQGATLAAGSNTWIPTNNLSAPGGASNPKLKASEAGNALAAWVFTTDLPEAVPFSQIQASYFPFELQPPIPPISPISSPSNFAGSLLTNRFATQTDLIHVLTWKPSPSLVEGYRLFENGVLVATIPASGPFIFTLHNRCRGQTYTYTLVAFNGSSVSSPVTLTLP